MYKCTKHVYKFLIKPKSSLFNALPRNKLWCKPSFLVVLHDSDGNDFIGHLHISGGNNFIGQNKLTFDQYDPQNDVVASNRADLTSNLN